MRGVSMLLLIVVTLGACAQSGTARYERAIPAEEEARSQTLMKCQDEYIEREKERVYTKAATWDNPLTRTTSTFSTIHLGPSSIDACLKRHGYVVK
jgi:hypothetical protein